MFEQTTGLTEYPQHRAVIGPTIKSSVQQVFTRKMWDHLPHYENLVETVSHNRTMIQATQANLYQNGWEIKESSFSNKPAKVHLKYWIKHSEVTVSVSNKETVLYYRVYHRFYWFLLRLSVTVKIIDMDLQPQSSCFFFLPQSTMLLPDSGQWSSSWHVGASTCSCICSQPNRRSFLATETMV